MLKVRASTEAEADFFEASVAGFTQVRLSGELPWQTVILDVPAGSQRVDLLYRKDTMTEHGADAVWVDAVKVLPAPALSLAEAVEANFSGDLAVTTVSAAWFTLRMPNMSADGGDVLVLQPSPPAAVLHPGLRKRSANWSVLPRIAGSKTLVVRGSSVRA